MYLLNLVIPGCNTLYHHNNEANPDDYEYNYKVYTFANFRIEPVNNRSDLEIYDADLVFLEDIKEVRDNLTQVGGGLLAEIIKVQANGLPVLKGRYQVSGGDITPFDEIYLKLQDPTRMITNYTIPTKHFNTIDFPELQ